MVVLTPKSGILGHFMVMISLPSEKQVIFESKVDIRLQNNQEETRLKFTPISL